MRPLQKLIRVTSPQWLPAQRTQASLSPLAPVFQPLHSPTLPPTHSPSHTGPFLSLENAEPVPRGPLLWTVPPGMPSPTPPPGGVLPTLSCNVAFQRAGPLAPHTANSPHSAPSSRAFSLGFLSSPLAFFSHGTQVLGEEWCLSILFTVYPVHARSRDSRPAPEAPGANEGCTANVPGPRSSFSAGQGRAGSSERWPGWVWGRSPLWSWRGSCPHLPAMPGVA